MLISYNVSKLGLLTIYLRFYGHLAILAQIKPVYMLATPQASNLSSGYELHFCFLKTNNLNAPASVHILHPESFVFIIQPPNIPSD